MQDRLSEFSRDKDLKILLKESSLTTDNMVSEGSLDLQSCEGHALT